MKPTSLKDIARLMQLPLHSHSDAIIKGVSVDSRLSAVGDLFFALPGAKTDGHSYLSEAASKAASAAVVKKGYAGSDYGLPLIYSDDVLASLQLLAKTYLKMSQTQVIAVTGSLGKTTTKDFITTLLKDKYRLSSSPGNSNSQIGLPLAIMNHLTLDDEILILEMSMTHPGQIAKLVDIAPPAIAVITMVALVHACNFNSIQDIAKAKAELFGHPDTRLGIYPKECDMDKVLSGSGTCKKVSFSVSMPEADYHLTSQDKHMTIKCPKGECQQFNLLALPGAHNRHNFLAAAVTARHVGMSWDEIRARQVSLVLPERRMQIVEKFGAVFVNDSYNASEISLKAALSSLPKPKGSGKRIAVVGEMLELGKFSRDCHRAVGEHALKTVDSMLCLGQDCEPIYECWKAAGRPVYWSLDRSQVVAALRSQLQSDDVVLLKGSRSKGMWNVLDEL